MSGQSTKDLSKLRKDDLIKLITDAKEKTTCTVIDHTAVANDVNTQDTSDSMVQAIIVKMKPLLDDCMKELRDEISALKEEVSELKSELLKKKSNPENPVPQSYSSVASPSLTKIMQTTMKDTLNEEKTKAQVVIANAKETGKDVEFMTSLCDKVKHKSMPKAVARIGRKEKPEHSRLMKVTFDSNFDARTFMSCYEAAKSDETSDKELSEIRIRPCRTKSEQTKYKAKLIKLREMNKTAKDDGDQVSFSLRDNGNIWRYVKHNSGKWKRDTEWKEPQTESVQRDESDESEPSGNGQ